MRYETKHWSRGAEGVVASTQAEEGDILEPALLGKEVRGPAGCTDGLVPLQETWQRRL